MNNNNTRPVLRADVNGKIVTRHVKDDVTGKPPVVVPAPQISSSSVHPIAQSFFSYAEDTDFSGMNVAEVKEATTAIVTSISEDTMWEALTVLTKAMETTDRPLALGAALESNRFNIKIRDTWLESHGADLNDREAYKRIGGSDGYEAYTTAYTEFSNAYSVRIPDENVVARLVSAGTITGEAEGTVAEPIVHAPATAPVTVDNPYGDALLAAGVSTDFKAMDEGQTKKAVVAISNRISPDTMWDALTVLTKCTQETDHPRAVLDAMEEQEAIPNLRDSWLNKHGASLSNRYDYVQIGGSEGYGRYKEEYIKLNEALSARIPNKEYMQRLKTR